ncbi:MAG TPA: ABC transporter substrate-binding protein [Alphaproteobacteria bacterium]
MQSRRSFLAFLAAASTAGLFPGSADASPQAARAFIDELGNEAIGILQSEQPASAKAERLEEVFRRGFDFEAIGRFILGRYWNTASAQQRKEFLAAFTDFVTRSYARRLADETVSGFNITNVRDLGDGDYLARTEILRGNSAPLNYEWRVRQTDNGMRIVDIIIEGVSLLVTQRSDFTSVVQREGMDGLIRTLRAKASQ